MSTPQPRASNRRLLRWAFWMGTLCVSLGAAPSIIESLDEKGLLDRVGLGALADWKQFLAGADHGRATLETEFDATRGFAEVRALEQPERPGVTPRLITPKGDMSDEERRSLVAEAERLAPLALTRARMKRAAHPPGTPQEEFERAMADAEHREKDSPADPGAEPAAEEEPQDETPPPAPAPQ